MVPYNKRTSCRRPGVHESTWTAEESVRLYSIILPLLWSLLEAFLSWRIAIPPFRICRRACFNHTPSFLSWNGSRQISNGQLPEDGQVYWMETFSERKITSSHQLSIYLRRAWGLFAICKTYPEERMPLVQDRLLPFLAKTAVTREFYDLIAEVWPKSSVNQLVENIHYLHMVHSRRLEIRFYAAALHERTRMSFFNKSAAPSPMVFPRAQIKKGDEPPAVRINISEGNTTEFCETIIKSQSTRVLPLALYKHAMNTLWRGSASMKVRSTFVHVLYQVPSLSFSINILPFWHKLTLHRSHYCRWSDDEGRE